MKKENWDYEAKMRVEMKTLRCSDCGQETLVAVNGIYSNNFFPSYFVHEKGCKQESGMSKIINQMRLNFMPPLKITGLDLIPNSKTLPGTVTKFPWWQRLLGWDKPKKVKYSPPDKKV